ncbi:hypothetical protein EPUL_006139 [Erysiphe pulchra]|uniref:Cyclin N-terminal domain-containing protein n=1 Tax=Erysiphe pulchra TaxID=225359 RepID=A0A2S4PJV2_9PEZI|nr:hypothetical protein EPUL_006139 [Erysiphe pulchra]
MNYSEISLQYPPNNQSQNGFWSDAPTNSAPLSVNSILSDAPSLFEDNSSVASDPSTVPSSPPFPTIKLLNSLDDNFSTAAIWPNTSTCAPIKSQNHQHPKRGSLLTRAGRFPKQARPSTFVDSLVDSSASMVEAIWPVSAILNKNDPRNKELIPLREFIKETLHRSGTSYSTLQVTLYYLILIKPHVLRQEYVIGQNSRGNPRCALLCGRRMFLSALILASKYLQDRNFTAQAWSKISGLNVLEINKNEVTFLLAIDWQLHITETIFQRWAQILSKYFSKSQLSTSVTNFACREFSSDWKSMIIGLSPQLENSDGVVKPLSSLMISTPHSSYSNLGHMGQKTVGLEVAEPCLTEFQPLPKTLDPQSSGHATKRTISDLGPLPILRLTQNSSLITPYKSAVSEFGKLQAGSYANPDSFTTLTLSCNKSMNLTEFAPRSCASLHSTMKQTSILDRPLSEQLNLTNSQLNLSPLKISMSPTSCTSSSLDNPQSSLRYIQNHSRGKIFGLSKKLENTKINIFETSNFCFGANSENIMGLYSDSCFGRGTIDSNYYTGCKETIHPLKFSCQNPTTMSCSFRSDPCSDLSRNIGSNRNRHRDILGESHTLLLSKKRSGADFICSPSICDIGETKYKFSASDTSAPRKRLCWALEASNSLNNNLYPTSGTQNGSSQLK